MEKTSVLFLCIHNSARSQMAEAFLEKYGGLPFQVESAGFEPGTLNPIVVEAMQETGIDISRNTSKGLQVFLDQGTEFDYVITVCDEGNAERCPVFPGKAQRLHWGFEDPSGLGGSHREKLEQTRIIRGRIERKVLDWLKEMDDFRK
ncbi:MAG: arsenate reductase ArsC [bacterium]|nr:arsenate reductase ArsC [bacterium]